MPGMVASIRTRSGVIWSSRASALEPSSATRTVIPASSSASVRTLRVSGESSTTSAISRRFASSVIAEQCLQDRHVLLQIELLDERAHLGDEGQVSGIAGLHI